MRKLWAETFLRSFCVARSLTSPFSAFSIPFSRVRQRPHVYTRATFIYIADTHTHITSTYIWRRKPHRMRRNQHPRTLCAMRVFVGTMGVSSGDDDIDVQLFNSAREILLGRKCSMASQSQYQNLLWLGSQCFSLSYRWYHPKKTIYINNRVSTLPTNTLKVKLYEFI